MGRQLGGTRRIHRAVQPWGTGPPAQTQAVLWGWRAAAGVFTSPFEVASSNKLSASRSCCCSNSTACPPTVGLAAAGTMDQLIQHREKRGRDGPRPSSIFYGCPLCNGIISFFPSRNQGVATHPGGCNLSYPERAKEVSEGKSRCKDR